MAAVDYARLRSSLKRSRLLFIAHRSEILQQSQATFRHVLRDGAFGELWVGGHRPQRFEHVFASIQSISAVGPEALGPDDFDVVILDEFHHAAATTYREVLERLTPVELLGLTATPERSDGQPILSWFEGRIAAELRLWDAIAEQHLSPFTYFGIADEIDLRSVPWRRGRGYDPTELTAILTADHAWAHHVLAAVERTVPDAATMRAIGFCVSVVHARFMADRFNEAGVAALVVTGATGEEDRKNAVRLLERGDIRAIFTVDLFNEGVDIPSVDTLLFLRPTDSPTLFLQQLGRGLRRTQNKATCTVLDFVGRHREEFRYDRIYGALLGRPRAEVARQVENGFPYLPAGCSMQLDEVARERILHQLRVALPATSRRRREELESLGDVDLRGFLAATGLDLPDVYSNGHSWSELRRAAGLTTLSPGPNEDSLLRAVGRLSHVDDPERISAYRTFLAEAEPRDVLGAMPERSRRLARMIAASLTNLPTVAPLHQAITHLWQHPQVRKEAGELLDLMPERIGHLDHDPGIDQNVPLRTHARYTRIEILAAYGIGKGARPPTWQEGVRWVPASSTVLAAFTLDKTGGDFSPTTRYRDYAISPELIHWESQAITSVRSTMGQRYLQHKSAGITVMLFARLRSTDRAFWCLGPATYVRHEGERPIAITWRLDRALPADLFERFAAAVA